MLGFEAALRERSQHVLRVSRQHEQVDVAGLPRPAESVVRKPADDRVRDAFLVQRGDGLLKYLAEHAFVDRCEVVLELAVQQPKGTVIDGNDFARHPRGHGARGVPRVPRANPAADPQLGPIGGAGPLSETVATCLERDSWYSAMKG